jgi:hypothetical protein
MNKNAWLFVHQQNTPEIPVSSADNAQYISIDYWKYDNIMRSQNCDIASQHVARF